MKSESEKFCKDCPCYQDIYRPGVMGGLACVLDPKWLVTEPDHFCYRGRQIMAARRPEGFKAAAR